MLCFETKQDSRDTGFCRFPVQKSRSYVNMAMVCFMCVFSAIALAVADCEIIFTTKIPPGKIMRLT